MKKIIACLIAAAIALASCMVVSAEKTEIGYYVKYEGDKATVYFETQSLSAFDFGILYDPDEVTIEAAAFSDYYRELSDDDAYTVLGLINKEAVDEEGNTYVVFTGAAMNNENGEPVESTYQEIGHVVISGIDEGDVIGLVSDTAQVNDVRNAEHLGAYDLYNQSELFDSDIFDGAKPEQGSVQTVSVEEGGSWIYVLVIAAVVVVAAVLIIVSKKNNEGKLAQNEETRENEQDEQ